jgi:uncharacterized protein (DUF302 family)
LRSGPESGDESGLGSGGIWTIAVFLGMTIAATLSSWGCNDETGFVFRGDNSMKYHLTKVCQIPFEEAVNRVVAGLKSEGFGVLTEIDVKATLKKKLDVDFRDYKILGACNPHFAYQALQAEDKIGTMLPCNVVVQEAGGGVEVSAVDPVASMMAIRNPKLESIAAEVRNKLQRVIDSL